MSMILPRGIVVNSEAIGGSIEQLDTQPVGEAEIARLWKVYTTTQRRLKDPTAERLENLWWRIWGSRDKKLKGAIVAKLFAQISDGETFVPLRGPPNRDEGPPLNTRRRVGPGASSATAIRPGESTRPGHESSSSSKSQVPMPHPILKKTRGPSNSGPRPTARFISPHDTEDEASPGTSESTNAHVVVEPPSPQEPQESASSLKKSTSMVGKKKGGFVAATKKRRPVIVKRQGSQTSQSSNESPARNSELAHFSAIQSSSERTPPTFAAQSRQRPQSRFQENFSPSSGQSLNSVRSPKKRVVTSAAGSKHVSMRKSSSGSRKAKSSSTSTEQPAYASSGEPGPSTTSYRVNRQEISPTSPESLTNAELQELEVQRVLLEEANARVERQNQRAARLIEQAKAEAAAKRLKQQPNSSSDALSLLSNQSKSKSTVSLAAALAAPAVQLHLGDPGDVAKEGLQLTSRSASMGRLDKGKGRDPEDLRRSAMFAKRQAQVQPASTTTTEPEPSSTLSRSKSQLTLLLEKDRARAGDKDRKPLR